MTMPRSKACPAAAVETKRPGFVAPLEGFTFAFQAQLVNFAPRAPEFLDLAQAHSHFPRVLKKSSMVLLLLGWTALCPAAEPERSVVQIMTFSQQPEWDAPWRFEAVRRS